MDLELLVGVNSAVANAKRRHAIRDSWFKYLASTWNGKETSTQKIQVYFIIASTDQPEVTQEAEDFGDICFVDALEGYEHLWRKVLVFFQRIIHKKRFKFFMHADDDSFVRIDLIKNLIGSWPSNNFYWGYVWNLTPESPRTSPIRDPKNKSYMPAEQYPFSYYPPFASGCCFVLSCDLVEALGTRDLPDYRLLDPPFGIHLCGNDMCILESPVTPVHEPRIRPYRPLPLFRPDTLVQHYMYPEEMKGYYKIAQKYLAGSRGMDDPPEGTPAALYEALVQMGVLR